MANVNHILENYKNYLRLKHPVRLALFERQEEQAPHSARAEAVVFVFLRHQGLSPNLEEDPGTGGVDFKCNPSGAPFFVEVTSVDQEAAARRSGIPTNPDEQQGFWFDLITRNLWDKVYRKTRQFATLNHPGLLVITSEHPVSSVFFGKIGAQHLLAGELQIQVPIGQADGQATQATNYNNSAFITRHGDIHEPSQRISGIILMGIFHDRHSVVGILNPDPKHPFSIGHLPSVPFLRLDTWPPRDGTIRTQWVINDPSIPMYEYRVFALTDEEYRTLE